MIRALVDEEVCKVSVDFLVDIYQELNFIIKNLDKSLCAEDVFSEVMSQFLNEKLENMIFKELNILLTDVHKGLLLSGKEIVVIKTLREARLYNELRYVTQEVVPILLQFVLFILFHDEFYDQEKEALLTKWVSFKCSLEEDLLKKWVSFKGVLNCSEPVSPELAQQYRHLSEEISARIRYKFYDSLVEKFNKRFRDLDHEVISSKLDGFLTACIYFSFLTTQNNQLDFEFHVQLLEGSIAELFLPSQAVCKKCLAELLQCLDDGELGDKQFDENEQLLLYNQFKKHYDSIDLTDDYTQWEITKKFSLVHQYNHQLLSLLIQSLPNKIEILCRYYKYQSELYIICTRYASSVMYSLNKEKIDRSIDISDDSLVALFDGIMCKLKCEHTSFINQLIKKEINTRNDNHYVIDDLFFSYTSYKEHKSAFDNQCNKDLEFWSIHVKYPQLQFNDFFKQSFIVAKENCKSRFELLDIEAACPVIDKSNEHSDKAVTFLDNHGKNKQSSGQKIEKFFIGRRSRNHPVDVMPDTELSSQIVQPSLQIQR